MHGVLLTDLPVGADPEREAWFGGGPLAFIRLVAPTTPPERMREIAEHGSGFVYLISRLGVTGMRDDMPGGAAGDGAAAARSDDAAGVRRLRRLPPGAGRARWRASPTASSSAARSSARPAKASTKATSPGGRRCAPRSTRRDRSGDDARDHASRDALSRARRHSSPRTRRSRNRSRSTSRCGVGEGEGIVDYRRAVRRDRLVLAAGPIDFLEEIAERVAERLLEDTSSHRVGARRRPKAAGRAAGTARVRRSRGRARVANDRRGLRRSGIKPRRPRRAPRRSADANWRRCRNTIVVADIVHRGDRAAGRTPQPWYLNQMVALETSLTPHQLLTRLQSIEARRGRRARERWAPRTLDLDIVCFSANRFMSRPAGAASRSWRAVPSGSVSSPSCEEGNEYTWRQPRSTLVLPEWAKVSEKRRKHIARVTTLLAAMGERNAASLTTSGAIGSTPGCCTTRSRTRPTPSSARWSATSRDETQMLAWTRAVANLERRTARRAGAARAVRYHTVG